MKNPIKQAKNNLYDYIFFHSMVRMGMPIDGQAYRRSRRKSQRQSKTN